jgi:predicted MarR family transcription regulator
MPRISSKTKAASAKPADTEVGTAGVDTHWHLATTPLEAAAAELEWSLLRWQQAYSRFTRQALNMLDLSTMSVQEMDILHVVGLHDRPKPAGMIANLLNRDDLQNIQYSLRKLLGMKLVQKAKDGSGKNVNLTVTNKGRQVCDEYANIRRMLLIEQVGQLEDAENRLLRAAKTVSIYTGLYDEAGRISPSYRSLDTSSDE